MHIDKARRLRYGDVVHFPADRGSPAGYGRVNHVSTMAPAKTINGTEYIWIGVRGFGTWPSNRLS